MPQLIHAIVSGVTMVVFVAIALLLNMAEVETSPTSRRPSSLGHSGAEVMAFAIKVLLTLVGVFIGYKRVAACLYLALSLWLLWQYLRWVSGPACRLKSNWTCTYSRWAMTCTPQH